MATLDVTTITDAITASGANIVSVSLAVLGVAALIFGIRKVYNAVSKG